MIDKIKYNCIFDYNGKRYDKIIECYTEGGALVYMLCHIKSETGHSIKKIWDLLYGKTRFYSIEIAGQEKDMTTF